MASCFIEGALVMIDTVRCLPRTEDGASGFALREARRRYMYASMSKSPHTIQLGQLQTSQKSYFDSKCVSPTSQEDAPELIRFSARLVHALRCCVYGGLQSKRNGNLSGMTEMA